MHISTSVRGLLAPPRQKTPGIQQLSAEQLRDFRAEAKSVRHALVLAGSKREFQRAVSLEERIVSAKTGYGLSGTVVELCSGASYRRQFIDDRVKGGMPPSVAQLRARLSEAALLPSTGKVVVDWWSAVRLRRDELLLLLDHEFHHVVHRAVGPWSDTGNAAFQLMAEGFARRGSEFRREVLYPDVRPHRTSQVALQSHKARRTMMDHVFARTREEFLRQYDRVDQLATAHPAMVGLALEREWVGQLLFGEEGAIVRVPVPRAPNELADHRALVRQILALNPHQASIQVLEVKDPSSGAAPSTDAWTD